MDEYRFSLNILPTFMIVICLDFLPQLRRGCHANSYYEYTTYIHTQHIPPHIFKVPRVPCSVFPTSQCPSGGLTHAQQVKLPSHPHLPGDKLPRGGRSTNNIILIEKNHHLKIPTFFQHGSILLSFFRALFRNCYHRTSTTLGHLHTIHQTKCRSTSYLPYTCFFINILLAIRCSIQCKFH